MTVEKHFPSGAWIITEIVNNGLVTRKYYGFTKREAITLFKRETNKWFKRHDVFEGTE